MNVSRATETATNIATTAAALVLCLALTKAYLLPANTPKVPAMPAAVSMGSSLNGKLPGVPWGKNGRTLVLAISTVCHFCKESEPFYRRLQAEAGKGVTIVAALPQPVGEAKQYLAAAGVQVDDVRQVTLSTLGVRGTPTILITNNTGHVINVWIGRLQPAEEEQVLSILRGVKEHQG
jgi:hypothetical protein